MPAKRSRSPDAVQRRSPSPSSKRGSREPATSPPRASSPPKTVTPKKTTTPAASKKSTSPAASPQRKGGKKQPAVVDDKQKEEPAPGASPLQRRASSGAVTEESVLSGTVPFARKTKDADFEPATMLKLVTWNVAGLRALLDKKGGLQPLIKDQNPDIICLQETKLSEFSPKLGDIPGYTMLETISTGKKGYSGCRTYVKNTLPLLSEPIYNLDLKPGAKNHEEFGRVVVSRMEPGLCVVNTYVPNAGMTLDNLKPRVGVFDPRMRAALSTLMKQHPGEVIWTGDLNVAERDYDRFFSNSGFKSMQKSPGFTPEERASFRMTLAETGLVDSLRQLYPNAHKVYTFWSARFNQRAKNNGWRLDYFVVAPALAKRVVDCFPLPSYHQSDHCPLVMWLKKH